MLCAEYNSERDGERNQILLGTCSSEKHAALFVSWIHASHLRSRRKLSGSQM